jgi:putative chitinase
MTQLISKELLEKFLPNNDEIDDWHSAINAILPKYDINNHNRIAAFLAQTAHESAEFTALKENLNYSAEGLAKTWPKRFSVSKRPNALAKSIERNPELIANNVYSDRMGNGPAASGDGFKYRGRGLIQLTGKDNYTRFSKSINMSLDEVVKYLETKEGAVESACWFWANNNLNTLADKKDITSLTKRINGGTVGLDDRIRKYNKVLALLGDENAGSTTNFYT